MIYALDINVGVTGLEKSTVTAVLHCMLVAHSGISGIIFK